MPIDGRAQLERVLIDLARQPGVTGAMLVRRDGLYLSAGAFESPDFFSATALALHASAENAMGDAQGNLRLLAQMGLDRIVTWGLDEQLVLVLRSSSHADVSNALAAADSASRAIQSVLKLAPLA